MKIYFITLITILIGNVVVAGNTSNNKEKGDKRLISGKVIDKISGEEIAGAEIKIDDKIIYSDLNGNFMTSIQIEKTEAMVSFISYNVIKVNIDTYAFGEIVIQLESK